MVGLVVVSHSAKLADGVVELALSMQPELKIRAAGGTEDGRLGTSAERILQAIIEVDDSNGVLVLVDLGSAVMSAEIALEWLADDRRARVVISDAPLVEGTILAATSASPGMTSADLDLIAQAAREFPKNVGPVPVGSGEEYRGTS